MSRRLRPRAVVFDLDGTLLDSLTFVLGAITHAVEPFGSRPTMEIFAQLGGPPERYLGPLLNDLRHLPHALERLAAFHRENAHLIRPYKGVTTVLARLRELGLRLAVWTGRDRDSTAWLLRNVAIEAFFDTTVCGDDLPTHKPDPEGLREILRRLEVDAVDTLLVGDADVDVLGGAACGVETLLIRRGRRVGQSIVEKAWRTAETPDEAFSVVLECVQNSDFRSSERK